MNADDFADFATIRTVELHRVATGILQEMFARLDELDADVSALIVRIDPTGVEQGAARRKRLEKLRDAIEERAGEVRDEIARRLMDDFEAIAEKQEADEREQLGILFGVALAKASFDIEAFTVAGSTIETMVSNVFQGFTVSTLAEVTGGYNDNLPADKIILRTHGGDEGAALPGSNPTETAKRSLEVATRTTVPAIESQVLSDIVEENAEKIRYGWQHISVLDNRTTSTCRARAWKIWDSDLKPVGHALPYAAPPLHLNCRSRIILYVFGDKPANPVTFKQWMARKTHTEQDDIFGAERMRLWRRGLLTDTQLIQQTTRPIPLDEFLDE